MDNAWHRRALAEGCACPAAIQYVPQSAPRQSGDVFCPVGSARLAPRVRLRRSADDGDRCLEQRLLIKFVQLNHKCWGAVSAINIARSITSSARAKNDSGIVSPITLAVLRLVGWLDRKVGCWDRVIA